MSEAAGAFRAASGADRLAWLDGFASRTGSGARSVIALPGGDDVSLSFAGGVVRRHRGQSSEEVGDDIFTALDREIAADAGDPSVTWVGYFGYAARNDLPARRSPTTPDAVWMRVRGWEEHLQPEPGEVQISPSTQTPDVPATYSAAYDEVQRQLRDGNSYEVNLTYREQMLSDLDPVDAYLRLRELNPAPYSCFLRHGDTRVLMTSPEQFVRIDAERGIWTRPIKGTTPRGADPDQDLQARLALLTEQRYRAENLMICDLLRNDLSMVCEAGSVTVPQLMEVESYASVHQLVSTVAGRLRPEVSTVEAVRALFPPGSMTGAPKRRTMEIIDRVEATPRGAYSGVAGWISCDGTADLGVVIRTLVASPVGTHWMYELGTGGGITVHSTPESEYAESRWKAERLLLALME